MRQVQIKMLRRDYGHDVDEAGISGPRQLFNAGEIYTLGEGLAKSLIASGSAEPYTPSLDPENFKISMTSGKPCDDCGDREAKYAEEFKTILCESCEELRMLDRATTPEPAPKKAEEKKRRK